MLMALFVTMTGVIGCGEDTTAPEPAPVNRAPGQPSINTATGAPDDGATGVATNIDLHWNCTDPDGDNLTFDVYFGTTSPPP